MSNAPKYCHTTDLFVRDTNFLHAKSRTTRTASFEANYCWMKDRWVCDYRIGEEMSHWTAHYASFRWQSRFKSTSKNRGEVTFFFKFDRRVDGAKCNRPDPTWDPQVDWGRLIGVDSQVYLPPSVFAYCGHTYAWYLTTTTTNKCGYQVLVPAIHLVTTRSSVYTGVAYQVVIVFKY